MIRAVDYVGIILPDPLILSAVISRSSDVEAKSGVQSTFFSWCKAVCKMYQNVLAEQFAGKFQTCSEDGECG